ncbi:MAG: hypothetical protein AAGA18_02280 [Verrucomicrobiota bacterium]
MKDIPKHLQLFIGVFVVVGLMGGAGWFFSSQQLDKANESKRSIQSKIRGLETSGAYPNAKSLEEIKVNLEQADALAAEVVPVLEETEVLFDEIMVGDKKGLSKDNWKKLLFEKGEQADAKAKEKRVSYAEDFFFGFARYRLESPKNEFTLELGRQMIGLFTLADILIEAGVSEILNFKRVLVESGTAFGDEELKAKVLPGGQGLYYVYPFEIEFIASPQALSKVVNGIAASKLILVSRFVSLKNEIATFPQKNDVTKLNTSQSGDEESDSLLYRQIAGQEKVKARIRVDMIVWKGEQGIEELNARVQEAMQKPKRK